MVLTKCFNNDFSFLLLIESFKSTMSSIRSHTDIDQQLPLLHGGDQIGTYVRKYQTAPDMGSCNAGQHPHVPLTLIADPSITSQFLCSPSVPAIGLIKQCCWKDWRRADAGWFLCHACLAKTRVLVIRCRWQLCGSEGFWWMSIARLENEKRSIARMIGVQKKIQLLVKAIF